MNNTVHASVEYNIEYAADGVYLLITAQEPVTEEGARSKLVAELGRTIADLNEKQLLYADIPPNKRILIAPPQEQPRDGVLEAVLSDDGVSVLMRMEPPVGLGLAPTREQALEILDACGAVSFRFDMDKINELLASEHSVPFTLVGEKADGAVDLIVTKDKLHVSATLIPPFGGEPLTVEKVLEHLAHKGVQAPFVDEQKIRDMLEAEKYGETFYAANGTPPVHGVDAWLQPLFDLENPKPQPSITDEGDVNYYELGVFSTVRIGDEVARFVQATAGRDGMTVFGQPIAAKKGLDLVSPCGNNTALSDTEADTIVSTINGRPYIIANKASVEPVLDVPGNVDFSTGNIDFKGFVNIKGNVISGFRVKASHDVNIEGTVEAADIEAGGDLAIKQGVAGQAKAQIHAGGDLFTKYLDKATVVVDGNLVVSESILHCDVSVDGGVFLGDNASNPRAGRIIGGVIRAKSSIKANVIGNDLQTETHLEIGLSKTVRATLSRMEKQIEEREQEADNIIKSLEFLEKKIQSGNGNADTQAQKRQATIEAYHKKTLVRKAREKIDQIHDSIVSGGLSGSKVLVKNTLHPGVSIAILDSRRKFTQEKSQVVVYEMDGDIYTTEYSAAFAEKLRPAPMHAV